MPAPKRISARSASDNLRSQTIARGQAEAGEDFEPADIPYEAEVKAWAAWALRPAEFKKVSYLQYLLRHIYMIKKKTKSSKKDATIDSSGMLRTVFCKQMKQKSPGALLHPGGTGRLVAVPVPLLLQIVLHNSGWLLNTFVQIVGPRGHGKSAFIFELMRLFSKFGGWGHLFDLENKFSESYAKSISGYPDELGYDVVYHHEPPSADAAQVMMEDTLKDLRNFMGYKSPVKTESDGTGARRAKKKTVDMYSVKADRRYSPVVMALDSLAAKPGDKTMDAIREQGHAMTRYQVEAGQRRDFLPTLMSDTLGFPICVVATNHLYVGQDDMGNTTERTPGGQYKDFLESFEIVIKATKRVPDTTQDVGETISEDVDIEEEIKPKRGTIDFDRGLFKKQFVIEMYLRKSSYGDSDNRIYVPISWVHRRGQDGEMRQYTKFEWSVGLVGHLNRMKKSAAYVANRINAIVNYTESDGRYTCSKYNLSGVSAARLGRAIERDPEAVAKIQDMFGIHQNLMFKQDTEYGDLLAILKKQASDAEARKRKMALRADAKKMQEEREEADDDREAVDQAKELPKEKSTVLVQKKRPAKVQEDEVDRLLKKARDEALRQNNAAKTKKPGKPSKKKSASRKRP